LPKRIDPDGPPRTPDAEGPAAELRHAADPDTPAGLPTDWAGLPFLLATAADAGLPGCALDDPDLADRPLAWVLHQVGQVLVPAAPDDAALLALAGLDPRRARLLLRAAGPTAAERAGVVRLAERWRAATATRLANIAAPHNPGCDVHRVARRPGRVHAEPGWIEVHLPLATVDPVLRRAGLDVDPGWVPWLGAVVRYCYG
jgi:hypothetical protein